jgi:hypothetical protein
VSSLNEDLKKYFSIRRGKVLPYSVEGNIRPSMPWKRIYNATIKNVTSQGDVTASLQSLDYNKDGVKIKNVAQKLGDVTVNVENLLDPAHVLEMMARSLDRSYMASFKKREPKIDNFDIVAKKLQDLLIPEKRADGDAPPLDGSLNRALNFFKENPDNLIIPEFYVSQEGIVRARWQHGSSYTLWLNFPEKGTFGWSVSFPRIGDHGLVNVAGKCKEARDIVPFFEKIGIMMRK